VWKKRRSGLKSGGEDGEARQTVLGGCRESESDSRSRCTSAAAGRVTFGSRTKCEPSYRDASNARNALRISTAAAAAAPLARSRLLSTLCESRLPRWARWRAEELPRLLRRKRIEIGSGEIALTAIAIGRGKSRANERGLRKKHAGLLAARSSYLRDHVLLPPCAGVGEVALIDNNMAAIAR